MPLRLDLLIVEKFSFTRSHGVFLIEKSCVYVNGQLIKKKHQKFNMEDMIEIKMPLEAPPKLEYVVVDDNFLIVNKPSGLVCHRSSTSHKETYVLNELVALDYPLSKSTVEEEFGLPHRIDKDTEGLVLMSRNDTFYTSAVAAFKNKEVKKKYLCIVQMNKNLKIEDEIHLSLFYGQDKVLVKPTGVESITSYKIIAKHGPFAVLEVSPITGRRHQIRVALSHMGSPVVGDTIYGGKTFRRLCLFASEISHQQFSASLYSSHIHDINNLLMELLFE